MQDNDTQSTPSGYEQRAQGGHVSVCGTLAGTLALMNRSKWHAPRAGRLGVGACELEG